MIIRSGGRGSESIIHKHTWAPFKLCLANCLTFEKSYKPYISGTTGPCICIYHRRLFHKFFSIPLIITLKWYGKKFYETSACRIYTQKAMLGSTNRQHTILGWDSKTVTVVSIKFIKAKIWGESKSTLVRKNVPNPCDYPTFPPIRI